MSTKEKLKAEIVFESDETQILRDKICQQEEQEELLQRFECEKEKERKRKKKDTQQKKSQKKFNSNHPQKQKEKNTKKIKRKEIKIDENTKFVLFPLELIQIANNKKKLAQTTSMLIIVAKSK
ncbi:hypothetical protein M0812_13579 [Anaeramoeba flamelloides]|uniref:Uncharacterized protein n=1 Tax=Anaeramoeba flamelloides TaxID=1746091 RepID=A0AAV7ZL67_9EUKA|nr:hypothetical protein M0812_13579 [Anaeramoeba flamelloides]